MTLALFGDNPIGCELVTTDAQCTPRDLALELGIFDLDPCSNPRSHIRATTSYSLENGQDGLMMPWGAVDGLGCPLRWGTGSIYLNPPYSDPLPWCQRLVTDRHVGEWCALLKLDPTTKWFATVEKHCDGWAAFRYRLAYERPGNCGVANFPSVLVWGGGWTVPDAVKARLWI